MWSQQRETNGVKVFKKIKINNLPPTFAWMESRVWKVFWQEPVREAAPGQEQSQASQILELRTDLGDLKKNKKQQYVLAVSVRYQLPRCQILMLPISNKWYFRWWHRQLGCYYNSSLFQILPPFSSCFLSVWVGFFFFFLEYSTYFQWFWVTVYWVLLGSSLGWWSPSRRPAGRASALTTDWISSVNFAKSFRAGLLEVSESWTGARRPELESWVCQVSSRAVTLG